MIPMPNSPQDRTQALWIGWSNAQPLDPPQNLSKKNLFFLFSCFICSAKLFFAPWKRKSITFNVPKFVFVSFRPNSFWTKLELIEHLIGNIKRAFLQRDLSQTSHGERIFFSPRFSLFLPIQLSSYKHILKLNHLCWTFTNSFVFLIVAQCSLGSFCPSLIQEVGYKWGISILRLGTHSCSYILAALFYSCEVHLTSQSHCINSLF